MYRQAIIEPTADLNQLDELFIVLGPKQSDKPADKPDAKPDTGSTSDTSSSSDTNAPSDANSPPK